MLELNELTLVKKLEIIVDQHKMPSEQAIALLSSAILFVTGQCDMENFATAVAHTRLCIPEDFQDATAALAGWLDEINEQIDAKAAK